MSNFFVLRSWGRLLYIFVWIKYGCKVFGGNRIQQWISSWGKLLPKFVKPHTISFWSNSQLALEFNRELFWFCFSSFYDWSKKITPLYQPIKFKTKPSRVLLDGVFPRCWLLTYFYFDFSLTSQPIKFKTKTSRVLVDRVFPRCRKLTYFLLWFLINSSTNQTQN